MIYSKWTICLFISIIAIIAIHPVAAFERNFIIEEFWCELDPVISEKGSSLTNEEAVERVLEEARYVLSGMIYGFRIKYTPSDKARNVKEIFTVEPVARIPWGDPNMDVRDTRLENGRYYITVLYTLRDFQIIRREAWESNLLPSEMGIGHSSVFSGYKEKYVSFNEAIKEAVRNYLRPLVLNKPKEIDGEALFLKAPYTIIDAGRYTSKVTIKLRIREVIPYRIY